MSEALRPDLSKAEIFQATHVFLRTDYETYFDEMLSEWHKNAERAREAGESIRPLWLRGNDEMGSEFGAVIDYIMPFRDGARYFASIDIDGTGGQTDLTSPYAKRRWFRRLHSSNVRGLHAPSSPTRDRICGNPRSTCQYVVMLQ